MRIPAPIVAVVTAALLLLLASALPQGDSAVPSWAGPHPSRIVSYWATHTANVGPPFDPPAVVVAAAPSRFIITDIHLRSRNVDRIEIRINSALVVTTTTSMHLASGIPVPAGAQVAMEAFKGGGAGGGLGEATFSGYTW